MKKTQILTFCCMLAVGHVYSMNQETVLSSDLHGRRHAVVSAEGMSNDQSDSFESRYQTREADSDESDRSESATNSSEAHKDSPLTRPRSLIRPSANSDLSQWPRLNPSEITQTQVTIQQSRISGYRSSDTVTLNPRVITTLPMESALSTSMQNFHIRGTNLSDMSQLAVDTRDPTHPLACTHIQANELESAMRTQKIARVLAVDGGGIRGLIPAIWCRVLEAITGLPLQVIFHMFAGTSTGGIIASALALLEPYSADEIVDLYMSKGRNIFVKRNWFDNPFGISKSKYRTGPAYGVYTEFFKDWKLSDISSDLVVTYFDLSHQVSKLFRSYMARENPILCDYYMRDVVASTTAAPTYFRPFKLRTVYNTDNNINSFSNAIDGGVYANNPSLHALKEATHLYSEADAYLLLSMGTGSFKEQLNPKSLLNWAIDITGIVMQGAEDTTSAFIHEYEQFFPKPIYFVRNQVGLYKEHKDMDNLSADNLSYLARLPEASASEIDKLRAVAPALRIAKTPREILLDSLVSREAAIDED